MLAQKQPQGPPNPPTKRSPTPQESTTTPGPKQIPLTCTGHTRPVVDLGFSSFTYTGDFFLISACKDSIPILRRGNTGDWVGSFSGHKGAVWSARLSRDATLSVTGSADFTAKVWNNVTGQPTVTLNHSHVVRAVDISDEGRYVLTAGYEKKIRIFDLQSDPATEAIRTLEGCQSEVKTALLDGEHGLVFAGDSKLLRVWDLRTSTQVNTREFDSEITSLRFSWDKKFIICTSGKTVYFYNAVTAALEKQFDTSISVSSASLHPSGTKFVCGGSSDLWVRTYDWATGQEQEVKGVDPEGNPLEADDMGPLLALFRKLDKNLQPYAITHTDSRILIDADGAAAADFYQKLMRDVEFATSVCKIYRLEAPGRKQRSLFHVSIYLESAESSLGAQDGSFASNLLAGGYVASDSLSTVAQPILPIITNQSSTAPNSMYANTSSNPLSKSLHIHSASPSSSSPPSISVSDVIPLLLPHLAPYLSLTTTAQQNPNTHHSELLDAPTNDSELRSSGSGTGTCKRKLEVKEEEAGGAGSSKRRTTMEVGLSLMLTANKAKGKGIVSAVGAGEVPEARGGNNNNEPNLSDASTTPSTGNARVFCDICLDDCTIFHYYNSKASPSGMTACPQCVLSRKYPSELDRGDFETQLEPWSAKEKALFWEAKAIHGEDYSAISEHIGSKSWKQVMTWRIHMPLEERLRLGGGKMVGVGNSSSELPVLKDGTRGDETNALPTSAFGAQAYSPVNTSSTIPPFSFLPGGMNATPPMAKPLESSIGATSVFASTHGGMVSQDASAPGRFPFNIAPVVTSTTLPSFTAPTVSHAASSSKMALPTFGAPSGSASSTFAFASKRTDSTNQDTTGRRFGQSIEGNVTAIDTKPPNQSTTASSALTSASDANIGTGKEKGLQSVGALYPKKDAGHRTEEEEGSTEIYYVPESELDLDILKHSWEDFVAEIDTVERNAEAPGGLVVFVAWKNGKRSMHDASRIHEKCPLKLFKFYESHLNFHSSKVQGQSVLGSETAPVPQRGLEGHHSGPVLVQNEAADGERVALGKCIVM
ncbi:hypothetical protein HDV00_009481 [Rhizophlyctis rosea]|nr:hypothetical protein HDV00_009481 [Rhizophlyctis rosea]